MKKLLCLILLVCMTASCACAEVDQIMLIKYNSCASVFGAPKLDMAQMKTKGTTSIFEMPPLIIGFDFAGDVPKTGVIYANDDAYAADFLASCMAMLYYLGDLDYTAFGVMLGQYMDIRRGEESIPHFIGTDVFKIDKSDNFKYCLIYMNNDLKTN